MTEVNLHLKTQITQDNEIENFEFVEPGELTTIGDFKVLKYDENQTIPAEFWFNENRAILKRGVKPNDFSELNFEPENQQKAIYTVNGNQIDFEILTKKFEISESNQTTKILLNYDLVTAGISIGHYIFELIFSE